MSTPEATIHFNPCPLSNQQIVDHLMDTLKEKGGIVTLLPSQLQVESVKVFASSFLTFSGTLHGKPASILMHLSQLHLQFSEE